MAFLEALDQGRVRQHRDRLQFLVTGSARLDVYRKGGDSLQGRYHHYRLHPLSLHELSPAEGRPLGATPVDRPGSELPIPVRAPWRALDLLLQYGGFPEPYLAQSARVLRRWQKERLERFFREDVRDLESVRDPSTLQLLGDMLAERVSSPLSLNSLREDLEVSHRALSHWLEVFEHLYHVFRLRPYASTRVRSLRKLPKVYLWDWSLVGAKGARFENLVASHLLEFCHFLQDHEGFDVQLFYFRDRAGREVDFIVTSGRSPWFAVEAKLSETHIDPTLVYLRERLRLPFAYQVVCDSKRDFVQDGVRCLPAAKFLHDLM